MTPALAKSGIGGGDLNSNLWRASFNEDYQWMLQLS